MIHNRGLAVKMWRRSWLSGSGQCQQEWLTVSRRPLVASEQRVCLLWEPAIQASSPGAALGRS